MDTTEFDKEHGPAAQEEMRRKQYGGAHIRRAKAIYEQGHAAITTFEQSEVVDAAPFTDDLSKQEMSEHLMDVHGFRGYVPGSRSTRNMIGFETKATKADLLRLHQRLHEAQDGPDAVFAKGRRDGYDPENNVEVFSFTLGGYPLPKVKHRHTAIVVTPEQSEALAAVRSNTRAAGTLSVQDRKVLKELVDNDFNGLKQEMKAFASDALSAKKSEINAQWDKAVESIPDFAGQATSLKRKQDDEWAALRTKHQEAERRMRAQHEDAMKTVTTKAEAKGVTLEKGTESVTDEVGRTIQRTVFSAKVQGRKDALDAAEKENKAFLDRALLTLEQQRLTAQRAVLLSGVPEGAMPIVESIPDAKALMVKAQEDQSTRQISTS